MRVRGALVVAALAVTVAGCSSSNQDLLIPPSNGPGQSPTGIPAAVRYVHRVTAAAAGVQQDVDAVEAALQIAATTDNTDEGTVADLIQLVQQEGHELASAEAAFRRPTARGQIGEWEAETVVATEHLDAALGALASYLADSNNAPTATPLFAAGSSEWNDAVTHLWSAAGLGDPPTLDETSGI